MTYSCSTDQSLRIRILHDIQLPLGENKDVNLVLSNMNASEPYTLRMERSKPKMKEDVFRFRRDYHSIMKRVDVLRRY